MTVDPRMPWEIPQDATRFVASALAEGRPAALGRAQRRDGASDEEVSRAHADLVTAIRRLPGYDDGAGLEDLSTAPAGAGWKRWRAVVRRTHADEDTHVVELARAVWIALGSHAYFLTLRERTRSRRAWWEMREWVGWGVTVPAVAVFFALEGDPWGFLPRPAWIVVGVVWVGVVRLAYRARCASLDRRHLERPYF